MSEQTSPRKHDYLHVTDIGYFAILDDRIESNRCLAWLRYGSKSGRLVKLSGMQAAEWVREIASDLDFHSILLDNHVHGVSIDRTREIVRARDSVHALSMQAGTKHYLALRKILFMLAGAGVPEAQIGVTGSLRLGLQSHDSDIDLIIYGMEFFERCRMLVKELTHVKAQYRLSEDQWLDAWRRRATGLDFKSYCWHERRKFNKLMLDGIKIDFTFAPEVCSVDAYPPTGKKLGGRKIRSKITGDSSAFASPARYEINHPQITEIVAPNATFTGQAFTGEQIEAQGIIEKASDDSLRLYVGTQRETPDQYLRVIRP